MLTPAQRIDLLRVAVDVARAAPVAPSTEDGPFEAQVLRIFRALRA